MESCLIGTHTTSSYIYKYKYLMTSPNTHAVFWKMR